MSRQNIIDAELAYLGQQQNIALEGAALPSEGPLIITPPWVTPPPGFQPFDFQGILATPAVGSGDQTVLSFIVPRGYNGVIRRISHNYTGDSYPEGSGGLVWRILADGRAVKNYGAMLFSFGNLVTPRPTDGILVYENQLVAYTVSVVNAGGFIPAASTFIICTAAGWIWPKQNNEV